MRIEIEKQIDTETKEVWSFNTFDTIFVFIGYRIEKKPKGKRKWTIEKYWDKYSRNNNRMLSEPVLPETIKSDVMAEFIKGIKVLTWDEWKQTQ